LVCATASCLRRTPPPRNAPACPQIRRKSIVRSCGTSPAKNSLCRLLFAIASLLVLGVSQASAQYMFLDSNGDGRHDRRDRLRRQGWSEVDVWLDLTTNRDPTERSTIAADKQTLAAYELAIHGSVTMEWGAFTPADPSMKVIRGPLVGTGEFYIAVEGSRALKGPKHRLGRLRLRPVSGNGDLEILPCLALEDTAYTSFQLQRGGRKLRLGPTLVLTPTATVIEGDWHDADGVRLEPEPQPSRSLRVDRGILYVAWNRMSPPFDLRIVEGRAVVNGYALPEPPRPPLPDPTPKDIARYRASTFAYAVGLMAQRWGVEATSAWIEGYQLSPAVDSVRVRPGGATVFYRGHGSEIVFCPSWVAQPGSSHGPLDPLQDLLDEWGRVLRSRSLLNIWNAGKFMTLGSGERTDEAIRKLQRKELLSRNDSLALERAGSDWKTMADPPRLEKVTLHP
jgi:hypothetical protein